MKRFILALILSFTSIVTFAQSQPVEHTPWIIENAGEWGSFQWQVIRQEVKSGQYYYMVFTFSNSYLRTSNGVQPAITFAKDVNVFMVENNRYMVPVNQINVYLPKIVCDHNSAKMITHFYSQSPYNTFRITHRKISPWDLNSKY